MIINVINLHFRENRRYSLAQHLEEMGCLYRFWPGVYEKQMPFKNVADAHKNIIRNAKEKKYPCVLIAEDDLRFSSPNSLNYFIQNIPDSYDLFLGMIYTGIIQDGRITSGFSGLQFYSISSRFYDTFLSIPEQKHCDMWLGENCHKYEFFVSDPFICYGQSGYSDNFKKQWTFKEESLPRKLLR